MPSFIFKEVLTNEFFKDVDLLDFGSVEPNASTQIDFNSSSPDITDNIVNLGIHFENRDEDSGAMEFLKLMGGEFPGPATADRRGVFVSQEYDLVGTITGQMSENITLAATDGAWNTHTDTITPLGTGINPGSVTITVGTDSWVDDGAGAFTAVLGNSTTGGAINYSSGIFTILWSSGEPTLPVNVAYSHSGDTYLIDTNRPEDSDLYVVDETFTSPVSGTTADIVILDEDGNPLTDSTKVESYDPDTKEITVTGFVEVGAGPAYFPPKGSVYRISGSSTLFVDYNVGFSEDTKIGIAELGGKLQTPNDKFKISFGVHLPDEVFLANFKQAFEILDIDSIFTWSLEEVQV